MKEDRYRCQGNGFLGGPFEADRIGANLGRAHVSISERTALPRRPRAIYRRRIEYAKPEWQGPRRFSYRIERRARRAFGNPLIAAENSRVVYREIEYRSAFSRLEST